MIAIRTDAGLSIGTGQVMRCLALALELGNRRVPVRFVCRARPGDRIAALREQNGFEVTALSFSDATADWELAPLDPPFAGLLGVPWQEDADETIAALRDQPVRALVVDHHALDARWEDRVAKALPDVRLFVIDDLADRRHGRACRVLLDAGPRPSGADAYAKLLPAGCTTLVGPRYALLRPEFESARRALRPRAGRIEHVFVSFGGTDPHDLTSQALEAVLALGLSADVVLGPLHAQADAIVRRAKDGRDRITVHHEVRDMAALMVRADVFLGGGGVTAWERCCLGLPGIIVPFAANQEPVARWLAEVNAAARLPPDAATADAMRTILAGFVADMRTTAAMAASAMNVLDGRGASRAADHLAGGMR